MKPKDLKSPYKWEDRVPLLKEGVFYVPKYYHKHDAALFPSWDKLFDNHHPVHIEYCSGNGEWIIHKAKAHPEINWVAIEMNFDRVRKIYSKRMNESIENLFIVSGEARTFSREYLSTESVQAAYINFPDPWPKDRHAKHRLVQSPFIEELVRVIVPQGTLTLVTDSTPYMEQMREVIQLVPAWSRLACPYENDYGNSYFERLWRSLGRSIHFLHYEKNH